MAQKSRHMSIFLDIFNCFLDDYTKQLNVRGLARLAGINRQTASSQMKKLSQTKLMSWIIEGRNKTYRLNLDSYKTELMLSMTETNMALHKLEQRELNVIIPELLQYADSIILFGSFSKGTQKQDSDIDLIIVGRCDKKNILKTVRRFPRKINMEFVTFAEFEKSLKQKKALALEILKTHTLYGKTSALTGILIKQYKGEL